MEEIAARGESVPRPLTPAVIARLARADNVAPSIRYRTAKALRAQARWCAERVARGEAPVPHGAQRSHVEDDWWADLVEAKRPGAMQGANDGYVIAERTLPAKSMSAGLLTFRGKKRKPAVLVPPDDLVTVGGEGNFIRRMEPQPVDKWLKDSSSLETDTSIRKYDELYEELINYRDPETGYGLNPKQVSKRLLEDGIAWSKARAELMARTTSIWALNEGASQFYVDAGFAEVEWMATEDAAQCEYCAIMDGKTWPTGGAVWEAGDMMIGKEGGAIQFPFDIQHPPIHPQCRCALLPVV